MSAKSNGKLLAILLIALAGTFFPAFPEKIQELMETMSKARIVSSISADTETAEDVLAKLTRRRRRRKAEKKRR